MLTAHGFVRGGRRFSTIDAPGATTLTVASGLNNRGYIVGSYVDGEGALTGFLRRGRDFSPIRFPGSAATAASGINDRGQIVGAYGDDPAVPARQLPHGFLLEGGRFRRIDVPGAVETRPLGINNRGHIVGEYVDRAGARHGFLLRNGRFTTIDYARGGPSTSAMGIDDRGRVVGAAYGSRRTADVRGFLWQAGTFTPIDAPGRQHTTPVGINDRGQIVGYTGRPGGPDRGFVRDPATGEFTPVDPPDAGSTSRSTTRVLDINDRGRMVGVYF